MRHPELNRRNVKSIIKDYDIKELREGDLDFEPKDIPMETFEKMMKFRSSVFPYVEPIIKFQNYSGKKVLEIGCGLCFHGLRFILHGADYMANDISYGEIELSKELLKRYGVTGKFLCGEIETFKLKDNEYDLIYSYGVLHHTRDIKDKIDEMFRGCKPGGEIKVMVYYKGLNYLLRVNLYFRILSILLYNNFLFNLIGKRLPKVTLEWLTVHRRGIKKGGLKYLFSPEFVNHSTDTYDAPKSAFFSKRECKKLFSKFENKKYYIRHFPLSLTPLNFLPPVVERIFEPIFGGFIFITGNKPDANSKIK